MYCFLFLDFIGSYEAYQELGGACSLGTLGLYVQGYSLNSLNGG